MFIIGIYALHENLRTPTRSHDVHLKLQPYIAYCPLGPGNAPLGGVKIDMEMEKGGSWAPIFNGRGDEQHDWVQLGSEGTCELYSRLYHEPPPWGNEAGTHDEEIARHVMCCLETVDGAYRGDEGKGLPSNDPDWIDRPPKVEEDVVALSVMAMQ